MSKASKSRLKTSRKDARRNALFDDFYSGNDDHIAALKDLLSQYRELHDGLSDMIEDDRLTESAIPKDYRWLVGMLNKLATDPDNSDNEPKED